MTKLGVVFFATPERIAFAQPGWSMSPVSENETVSHAAAFGNEHELVPTYHNVCGASGLLDDLKVVEAALHNLDRGILGRKGI
jgi:hypothetical protein